MYGKIVATAIGVVVLILGLGWIAQGNDFFLYQYFAPKYANVGRQVFEGSNSYNRGTIQNLRDAEQNYITAPADRRIGLGSTIVQQYADYPDNQLPNDLHAFMGCLRQHQTDSYDCSPGASNQ